MHGENYEADNGDLQVEAGGGALEVGLVGHAKV